MAVTLSKHAGFCPGVRSADASIRKLIESKGADQLLFTLGHLIHNGVYNRKLFDEGVGCLNIDQLESFIVANPGKRVTVAIRTHGITLSEENILEDFKKRYDSFDYVDLTCPYVKKIQRIAEDTDPETSYFLIYGDPNHPEVKGIVSRVRGSYKVLSSYDEATKVDLLGKIPILCSQTTQNLYEFEKIKKVYKKVYTNANFFDTICSVTEKRQKEAVSIASKADAMIVIGGKDSSNSKKLYELCKEACPATQFIEEADQLAPLSKDAKNIGITAGASTPDDIILEVFKTMENENFIEMLEGSLKTLHTGDTVTGTVYAIGENEIKLDLGVKFTGVLTKEQITDDPAAKLSEMFKMGDEIEVFVIRVEDGKGTATVSKKRVDADNSWVILKEAFEANQPLEGKVVSAIKGGVIVSVSGNTVFVPASQSGIAKDGDLSVLVGTTQKIKLLEFDVQRKKALGSIKAILVEEKKAKEAAIWAGLEVGQHYIGTVKNLASYGAFVDIGGIDGMVHNSELSWKKIKHPSQVVSIGQQLDVYIKELDAEKNRISLGYKTQDMDSWFKFVNEHNEGEIVSAKIVSLMPFGAFAEVAEDVDGLIHISRISTQRINSPAEVLKVGDVVDVMITEIDNDNRKLALSIRAITEAAEKAAAEEARAAEKAAREAEEAAEAERLAQERADMAPYIVGSI